MPIEYDRLLHWPFAPIEQEYAPRDSMLYALAVGLCVDPVDLKQLRFVFERDLLALPTMAVILGFPGPYLRDLTTGVTYEQIVHGEQSLTVFQPLLASGRVIARNRIDAIIDKGVGKGAVIYSSREISDAATKEVTAVLRSTVLCRADGGFGGPSGPVKPVHAVPNRTPDKTIELPTLTQAALIYRLLGDDNPLHVDPATARAAGFRSPILHGLCTFGVAGHALLQALCAYDPARLRRMDVRFTNPVYPGDAIRTNIWLEDPGKVAFRCDVADRQVTVIDNGYCEYEVTE
jgi:acyl dehydratase